MLNLDTSQQHAILDRYHRKKLLSFELSSQIFHSASLPQEPAFIAPIADHSLFIAKRDSIDSFNIGEKILTQLMTAPYDVHTERFNDGKCDAMGRLWVSAVFEPKTQGLFIHF
jgi:sugar lactone lactonase YvrE